MSITPRHIVLWVDDAEDADNSLHIQASIKHNIELVWFSNWEDAKPYYIEQHNKIAAVIWDCYCKIYRNNLADVRFLATVLPDTNTIDIQKNRRIPWYVLSAGGAKESFSTIMHLLNTYLFEERKAWDKQDKNYYDKNNKQEVDELLSNINKVAQTQDFYKIWVQYNYVCQVLRSGKINNKANEIMLAVLSQLHFPEKNPNFNAVLYYNQIRQVIEYIFRGLNKVGIIPDQCFPKGEVNLRSCSCYIDEKQAEKSKVQYRDPIKRIAPPVICKNIHSILTITNYNSHTEDDNSADAEMIQKYFSNVDSSYLLFSFAMQLCSVILWFDKYTNEHPNYDENISNCVIIEDPKEQKEQEQQLKKEICDETGALIQEYEGIEGIVKKDSLGNLFIGRCILPFIESLLGKKVSLHSIIPNENFNNKLFYPIRGKFKVIK